MSKLLSIKLPAADVFLGAHCRHAAVAVLLCASTMLAGCTSLIYKPEVLQGNFISKEQAAAVQTGMSREQARQILGTPLVTDLFRSDRWDYIFTLKNHVSKEPQKFVVTVIFAGDLVTRVEGRDALPSEQDFVNSLDAHTSYEPRNLEASPEQLNRFAEKNQIHNPSATDSAQ